MGAATATALHLRNGRAKAHRETFGAGITWCGKKLLGKPEREEDDRTVFSSYGSEIHVSDDPSAGTCERCRAAFDDAYTAAFPEGLKPLATFRTDSSEDMERAKSVLAPDTMHRFFGPDGEGMSAYERFLAASTPRPSVDGGEG